MTRAEPTLTPPTRLEGDALLAPISTHTRQSCLVRDCLRRSDIGPRRTRRRSTHRGDDRSTHTHIHAYYPLSPVPPLTASPHDRERETMYCEKQSICTHAESVPLSPASPLLAHPVHVPIIIRIIMLASRFRRSSSSQLDRAEAPRTTPSFVCCSNFILLHGLG